MYQISLKLGHKKLSYSNALIFEVAAAAILENGAENLVLRFLNSACISQYTYQISSKSGHNWPSYNNTLIFKMAAAAIFENGVTLLVLRFLDSASIC